MNQRHKQLFLLLTTFSLLGLMLSACGLPIENIPLNTPIAPPENAQPSPIAYNKIRFAVPTGTPTIANAPGNFWEWFWATCDGPYGLTTQGGWRGRGFPSDSAREVFSNTLTGLGYDIAGDPGRLFDETEDLQRAQYAVGGRVVDIKINECPQSTWFGSIPQGTSGEANVTVEWTIFDLLNRKNIAKLTTKGYGRNMAPSFDGLILLYEDAMAAAIHNLGTHKAFYDLVFFGIAPPDAPDTYLDPFEQPIGLFDPQEKVSIPAKALLTGDARNNLDAATKSSVLVQAGQTHGSGVFITDQGHIITNAHVVGNAKRVRIVTSGKKHKLKAEVLRVARKRDIALLKLEDMPADLTIKTLPIRTGKIAVGEEIYAVGAPRYTKLQDSVTKGIVSAHRYHPRQGQWFIQADVDIYGGSSGGPLLDEHGNLIGLTALGYIISGNAGSDPALGGLNWFIPIDDGLEKLDISITTP